MVLLAHETYEETEVQTARALLRSHIDKRWSLDGFSGLKLLWGVWGQDKTDLGTLGAVKGFRYP